MVSSEALAMSRGLLEAELTVAVWPLRVCTILPLERTERGREGGVAVWL